MFKPDETDVRIRNLYQDLSACLLVLTQALDKAGVLPTEAVQAAAQERYLTLSIDHAQPKETLALLYQLATNLPKNSGDS